MSPVGYIVKAARDADLYCEWSTVVDAPVLIGTRAEFLNEYDASVEPRLERADEHGTSARWPRETDPIFGWNHDEFLIMNGPGAGGTLKRADLEAYCRYLLTDSDESTDAAAALVSPLDNNDTTT